MRGNDRAPPDDRGGAGPALLAQRVCHWWVLPSGHPLQVRKIFSSMRLEDATVRVVDTEIEVFYEASRLLESKGRSLKLALAALSIAVVLVLAGILAQ